MLLRADKSGQEKPDDEALSRCGHGSPAVFCRGGGFAELQPYADPAHAGGREWLPRRSM